MAEWQRLTELYREMGDGELEELDADKADLTEMAQQVLRDELKKRGLDSSRAESPWSQIELRALWRSSGVLAAMRRRARRAPKTSDRRSGVHLEDAAVRMRRQGRGWQIREVLRQAGIESWIEVPGSRDGHEYGNPRIVVAADQLEKALEIISQPIPQEIVEQSKMQVPDYVPPVCPVAAPMIRFSKAPIL